MRVYTDLVPDIPQPLFEGLVEYLGEVLGCPATLELGDGADDPFSEGRADLGFLRSPSFLNLWQGPQAPVQLLPVAPVFRDSRAQGRPEYFAEVVVRGSHPAQSFWDLRGCIWGYSESGSLSSHISVLQKLSDVGEDERFFRSHLRSGSHLESLRLLRRGEVDAVAVDSNVLILARRRNPELRHELRVLESWGPLPIQPVVARRGLSPTVGEDVVRHLCRMSSLPGGRELLDDHWMSEFTTSDEGPYRQVRNSMRSLGMDCGAEPLSGTAAADGKGGAGLAARLRYFLSFLF